MIKVYHLNIISTEADRDELNRVGWDGHPRFALHADITCGDAEAAETAFRHGYYRLVAEVPGDDLDQAFMLTNTIDRAWTENEGMTIHGERHRSTSVGDVFECRGRFFMVAAVGFTELAQIKPAPQDESAPGLD